MIESGIFPPGAIQLICGSAGDLLDTSACRTPSRSQARRHWAEAQETRSIVENTVRFNQEADSLNCSILGPTRRPEPRSSTVREGSRSRDDCEGGAEVHGHSSHARA
jgi:oxepin-CoA hydrolase/3-oxo-5,6-dehydrosuberyl-CoA semialdehyde dehydrogenase